MIKILRFIILLALLLISPGIAHAPMLPPLAWQPMPLPREITDPRVDLLASLIHAEARGESYTGQVAVGAVVMNRVRDPRWPDTVEAVVRQPGQFAVSHVASDRAREAAKDALDGVDPTGGAVYFYAPEISTCGWIRTRETVCDIGGHRFAR